MKSAYIYLLQKIKNLTSRMEWIQMKFVNVQFVSTKKFAEISSEMTSAIRQNRKWWNNFQKIFLNQMSGTQSFSNRIILWPKTWDIFEKLNIIFPHVFMLLVSKSHKCSVYTETCSTFFSSFLANESTGNKKLKILTQGVEKIKVPCPPVFIHLKVLSPSKIFDKILLKLGEFGNAEKLLVPTKKNVTLKTSLIYHLKAD